MALQAIQATPKDRNRAFLVNQDTADMTTANSAWNYRSGAGATCDADRADGGPRVAVATAVNFFSQL
jgi:hypothetical protein